MQPARELVVVTGAAGFIGATIVNRLTARFQIVGLDKNHPDHFPSGAEFIECDLTSDASVSRAFAAVREKYGRRIASCIHLAAYYDFSGEPSPLYRKLTVEGTRRVLDELRRFDAEQFVFSSTLLLMKPAEEEYEMIDESSPVEAAWEYPKSKLAAEEEIRREHDGIPAVILRIAGVYDENCRSIPIAQNIARIYEKQFESFFFPGDADHGQPFVHLEDLVDCVEKTVALRAKLDEYEVFLIAEPEVISYGELQDLLGEQIHGTEWPTIRIPKVVAKAGAWAKEKMADETETVFIKPWMIELADDHYPVAIEHARARLGWEPKRSLRRTLPVMVERLKQDPEQWYKRHGLKLSQLDALEAAGRNGRKKGSSGR